jgi:hypothetical protein
MIRPARCLIGRRQATPRDPSNVSSKQRVAGWNPAGRGRSEDVWVLRLRSGDVGVAHRRHICCGDPALIQCGRPGAVGAVLSGLLSISPVPPVRSVIGAGHRVGFAVMWDDGHCASHRADRR